MNHFLTHLYREYFDLAASINKLEAVHAFPKEGSTKDLHVQQSQILKSQLKQAEYRIEAYLRNHYNVNTIFSR